MDPHGSTIAAQGNSQCVWVSLVLTCQISSAFLTSKKKLKKDFACARRRNVCHTDIFLSLHKWYWQGVFLLTKSDSLWSSKGIPLLPSISWMPFLDTAKCSWLFLYLFNYVEFIVFVCLSEFLLSLRCLFLFVDGSYLLIWNHAVGICLHLMDQRLNLIQSKMAVILKQFIT